MRTLLRTVLAAWLLVLSLCLGNPLPVAAAEWQAGVAKVNITPEHLMWLAGYASRTQPAEGKMTDLWAKALVLEDGQGSRAVLVTLDLIGLDRELSQRIVKRLQRQHRLERHQVVLNCSHTHSGPVVAGNLRPMHLYAFEPDQQNRVREYAAQLEEAIDEVVGKAMADLAPATVSRGVGATDFAVNRRTNSEPDVPRLRAEGKLQGPNDHEVPVLAVQGKDGSLRAIAFGYACHATVLAGYEWSGDYPGFAQAAVEEAHPGSVALFWAGCGGDQNPLPRRSRELAEKYGRQLADEVVAVLKKPLRPVTGRLHCQYAEVAVPLAALPTHDDLLAQAKDSNKYVAMRAKMLLEQIEAGRPLAAEYPYPIALWKLGPELQWVFLGGEVVVDYSLRTKSEFAGTRAWVAGYSHDVMAYIPSRRVLAEGGYEGKDAMVYYGLPTVWSEEVEEIIFREIRRQAKTAE